LLRISTAAFGREETICPCIQNEKQTKIKIIMKYSAAVVVVALAAAVEGYSVTRSSLRSLGQPTNSKSLQSAAAPSRASSGSSSLKMEGA
jgi:hypothetical protein